MIRNSRYLEETRYVTFIEFPFTNHGNDFIEGFTGEHSQMDLSCTNNWDGDQLLT